MENYKISSNKQARISEKVKKRVKQMHVKKILASNRNTSTNATEYSKFLFCRETKPMLLM